MNYIEDLLKADINVATSGDQTIIAAPSGSSYIAIDFIMLVNTTAQNLQMKDGTTAYGGALAIGSLGTLVLENSMRNEHGVITLSPGNAFKLNLQNSTQVSGFVRYRIVQQ